MSAFPTASSTVYYNEAGEPLGWSDETSFDPYDDAYFDDLEDEVDEDEWDDNSDPDLLLLDEGDDGIIDLHYDPATRSFRA